LSPGKVHIDPEYPLLVIDRERVRSLPGTPVVEQRDIQDDGDLRKDDSRWGENEISADARLDNTGLLRQPRRCPRRGAKGDRGKKDG
ncbi:MAG: hypothetical protein AABX36_01725, partial [Candidatus Thermoplasmatota archaeon]